MKTTHLLLVLGMAAAGAGLLARAYLLDRSTQRRGDSDGRD
ncbi:MAG: hypothetical protein ACQKBY_09500 [Verrucomicrobiales bacterium]